MLRKNLMITFILLIITINLDYLGSKYGKGKLFQNYYNTKFNVEIDIIDANYHVWSVSDYWALVYTKNYFPLNEKNEKIIYVDELEKIAGKNGKLMVKVLNSNEEDNIIIIDSVSKFGYAESFTIINEPKKIKKLDAQHNWTDMKPSIKLNFFIRFWPVLFWVLALIIIVQASYIYFDKKNTYT